MLKLCCGLSKCMQVERGPYYSARGETIDGYHGRRSAWRHQWRTRCPGIPQPLTEGMAILLDSLGHRINVHNRDRKPRVWFIGCSETFGHAVPAGQTLPEHYTQLTGIPSLNLGWPGGSNSWNCTRLLGLLCQWGAPEYTFFQWTQRSRFYCGSPAGIRHWTPGWSSLEELPRAWVRANTDPSAVRIRQWQVSATLAQLPRVYSWTPFPQEIAAQGADLTPVEPWGFPWQIPEELAPDGEHSSGARHLRWAQRAAEIYSG
jgi:hypothetical protein